MRITEASVYCVNIPFKESFNHNLYERNTSDSIIVELCAAGASATWDGRSTEEGISGYGEGIARQYVTGETTANAMEYIKSQLLPQVIGIDLNQIDKKDPLRAVNKILTKKTKNKNSIQHASLCAVELALIDIFCKSNKASISSILPPCSRDIAYSGVIGTGSMEKCRKIANFCKSLHLQFIKIKVSKLSDIERISLIRDIMGPSVSIRIDANCAFDRNTAVQFLSLIEKYDIACIEQPIPVNDLNELASLRANSNIPIMADESIVSLQDAERLIKNKAVDLFNLRISKCGGLFNTLQIAELANSAGVGIQLGCQVGETAILSAAGFHLASHLKNIRFIEGCYGTHLLTEDISEENMTFSYGGKIKPLSAPGMGIKVKRTFLSTYAKQQ